MRIHIYKDGNGRLSAFIEPSLGKGLSPILLEGVTAKNIAEKVLPVVELMRKPRAPR